MIDDFIKKIKKLSPEDLTKKLKNAGIKLMSKIKNSTNHQKFYYAIFTPDKKDGGYIVKFADFPEAITQGENIEDALTNAEDCLEEAIANRVTMEISMPEPSSKQDAIVKFLHDRYIGDDPKKKNYLQIVRFNAEIAQMVYDHRKKLGLTKEQFARKLGTFKSIISRLEDADFNWEGDLGMEPNYKYLMVTFTPKGRIDRVYTDLDDLLYDVIKAAKEGNGFEVYELPDECFTHLKE